LAEQLPVPAFALHEIPESVSLEAAALVEPGAGAVRAVNATALQRGQRLLVFGPGTIGLLATQFAVARGIEVDVVGIENSGLELARSFGAGGVFLDTEHPPGPFHAVIDATNDPETPAAGLRLVEPGGRVVLIGISGEPSLIDSRQITLGDVTVVGILGGSAGIDEAIAAYTEGRVVPDGLVSEVIGLDQVASRLTGERGIEAGPGPKVQVDPKLV
jgi:threonine dehydrogenase-like Zn-dependent dehydrogenase